MTDPTLAPVTITKHPRPGLTHPWRVATDSTVLGRFQTRADAEAYAVLQQRAITPAYLADLRWHIAPEDQGQIVEYAYASGHDGNLWMRVIDRADGRTTYYHAPASSVPPETWEPWNHAPEPTQEWATVSPEDTPMTISIFQDNRWAGDGKLVDGSIYDCAAILGPHFDDPEADHDSSTDAYDAIVVAIARGDDTVTLDGIEYTWAIEPEDA